MPGALRSNIEGEKERHAAIGVDLTTILGALELAQQYETGSYGQEEGEESADQESEEDDSDNEQAAPEDAEEEKEEQGAVEETDEDEDPDESEDYEEFVPDYAVRQKVQGPVSDSWFKGYGDNRCFDFSKLDHVGIPYIQTAPRRHHVRRKPEMNRDVHAFPELKQLEVDFVIPRLVGDMPLCIDPFLLYKSRDQELRTLHARIVEHFSEGVSALSSGKEQDATYILDFPEVPEIGFGYGATDKRGSGLGGLLTSLLIESLRLSPAIIERELGTLRRCS